MARRPAHEPNTPPRAIGPEWVVVTADVNSHTYAVSVVVVGIGIEIEVRLPPRRHDSLTHSVLHEVVVEVGTRSQAENEICDLRFRIIRDIPDVAKPVIPMITTDVLLEHERVARERRVHRAHTF
jgi:hypothetical protein